MMAPNYNLRILFLVLFLHSTLSGSLIALGQAPTDPPAVVKSELPSDRPLPKPEEIQARIKSLSEDSTLAEELKKELIEEFGKLLKELNLSSQHQQRRDRLIAAAAAAPEELAKEKRHKESLTTASFPSHLLSSIESQSQKAEISTRLEANLRQQQEIEGELRKREELKKTLPQQVVEARTRLQKLETEPPLLPDPNLDSRLFEVRGHLRRARLEVAGHELAALQQQSKTYEQEAELYPLRLDRIQRETKQLKDLLQRLSASLASQRGLHIEMVRNELETKLQQVKAGGTPSPFTERAQVTWGLMAGWDGVVQDSVRLEKVLNRAVGEAAEAGRELENIRAKIRELQGGVGLSSWMGLYFKRKREQLPNISEVRRELAQQHGEIERTKSMLADLDDRLDTLVDPKGSFSQEETELQSLERKSLEEMKLDLDKYGWTLINLNVEREKLIHDVNETRKLIDQHVLWMRSADPLVVSDLDAGWRAFQVLVHLENLRQLRTVIFQELRSSPWLASLWILVVVGLLVLAARVRRQLHRLSELAEKRNATCMRPTWLALLATLFLTLPLLIGITVPGWRLSEAVGASGYVRAIGLGLLAGACFLLPMELLRQMARPQGMAVSHFGWPLEAAVPLRTHLRWVIDLGLPLVIAWVATDQQRETRIVAQLSRILFISLMLVTTIVLWRVLHPQNGILSHYLVKKPGGWLDRLRYVWHPAVAGFPGVLAGLSFAGYGYLAGRLAIHLLHTTWVVIGVVVTGGMLTRWVLLSRRRMLLSQLHQRATDRSQNPVNAEIESGTPLVDVSQVSQQTLRLISALLTTCALLGLAWVWSGILPALNILDQVPLWGQGSGRPVTLTSLLLAIPIAVLTVIAVRNLPGLLETMILQHLPLETAARYAITSLSSYSLAFVGIVVSANVLGLQWQSIQWLVAALGVGLGFGLQEIFANFISGLILLFEQPIRVGDVITIDGTTGVVSRIRIRATTVTNWDRQELIIPNKDLITGRLLNWTLSDATNRIVIKVGVAYGTDTRRACEVLETLCQEHPNISQDPPATVTFDQFADSTLQLTIRVFLNSLDVRLRTIHELHTQIHESFQREGIEIAFPQQDLHIRSFPSGFVPRAATSSESRAA
jgi:potassium efflux system protein